MRLKILRLNYIYANILAYNKASIRLFECCGFQKDGLLRKRIYKRDEFADLLAYSRLISD